MKVRLRLTTVTVVWASVLVLLGIVVWGRAIDGIDFGTPAAIFLWLAALLALVSFNGGTAYQWGHRRWKLRDQIKDSWIVNARGRAMVWDGKSASMLIEVRGNPWELSLVGTDGFTSAPTIPLSDIRSELRQYDIVVNHIRVIEYGYKVGADDRASSSMLSVMGGVPHLLGGRVFVEVSITLSDNLNAVASRNREDSLETALTRTIGIATERVLRVFQTHNLRAHILTPPEALVLQQELEGSLGEAIKRNTWEFSGAPGDAEVGAAVSFVPTVWDEKTQQQWDEVLAHRQYNCLSLRPDGLVDRVSYASTYLVDDPSNLNLLGSQGLRRENGKHLSRIANLLPLSRDIPIDDDGGRVIGRQENPGLHLPVHPLGVFLGLSQNRSKVFMNITRGGPPLWIIGDDEFARRFVLRLSTQRHRITVSIPDQGWYDLVQARNSSLLVFDQLPSQTLNFSDVIICTPEQATELETLSGKEGPALVVVSEYEPPLLPHATLAGSDSGEWVYAQVGGVAIPIIREKPPTERQWIPDQEYAR